MQLFLVYAAVFVLGLIVFERLTGTLAGRLSKTRSLNRRLQLLEGKESTLETYKGMLRERALDYDRAGFRLIVLLRRLFAQSGLRLDISKLAVYAAAVTVVLWVG